MTVAIERRRALRAIANVDSINPCIAALWTLCNGPDSRYHLEKSLDIVDRLIERLKAAGIPWNGNANSVTPQVTLVLLRSRAHSALAKWLRQQCQGPIDPRLWENVLFARFSEFAYIDGVRAYADQTVATSDFQVQSPDTARLVRLSWEAVGLRLDSDVNWFGYDPRSGKYITPNVVAHCDHNRAIETGMPVSSMAMAIDEE